MIKGHKFLRVLRPIQCSVASTIQTSAQNNSSRSFETLAAVKQHPALQQELFPFKSTTTTKQVVQHHQQSPAFIFQPPKVCVTQGLSSFTPRKNVVDYIREKTLAYTHTQVFSPIANEPALAPATSFFVLDITRVEQKLENWHKCFPAIHPYYAVKSNPNPELVNTLAQKGANFDCASATEMLLCKNLGVSSDRMIFANPCKKLYDLQVAKKIGVTRGTFDSVEELEKIHQYYPEMELVLRIPVDDRSCKVPMSKKFGAPSSEWTRLFHKAKELGLSIIGVSFHVGSGGGNLNRYEFAVRDALSLFKQGSELGFNMKLLDIGGGYPGTCSDEVSLQAVANVVNPLLKEFPTGTEFIAEPGRYFCSESQTLATMIIGKRTRDGKTCYFIGDSLYQSFNCILFDHAKLPSESPNEHSEELQPCTIFGHTCDGIDQLSSDMMLPNLSVGDWLVFPSMGAYTNAASTTFNGFRLPELLVLKQ